MKSLVAVSACLVVLSLIPLYSPSLLPLDLLAPSSPTSEELLVGYSGALATCFPLLFHILLDLLIRHSFSFNVVAFQKIFMIVVLQLPGIYFLVHWRANDQFHQPTFTCLLVVQQILVVFTALKIARVMNKEIWSLSRLVSIMICWTAANLLLPYSLAGRKEAVFGALRLCFLSLGSLALMPIFIKCIRGRSTKLNKHYWPSLLVGTSLIAYTVGCLVFTALLLTKSLRSRGPSSPLLLNDSFQLFQIVGTTFLVVVATTIPIDSLLPLQKVAPTQRDPSHCFIRYVSHQLRTPINVAVLGLELLDGELPGLVRSSWSAQLGNVVETLKSIENAFGTMTSILDDLLAYDKIVTGGMKLSLAVVNPVTILQDCVTAFKMDADAKSIELKTSSGLSSIAANARVDPDKLMCVFHNLISNAIKYSTSGSRVSVHAFVFNRSSRFMISQESWIRIEITDAGIGISPEHLTLLFRESVSFDATELKGSGLGLFISKGIVELHGGRIGAISDGKGLGSTFFVELPLLENLLEETTEQRSPVPFFVRALNRTFSSNSQIYSEPIEIRPAFDDIEHGKSKMEKKHNPLDFPVPFEIAEKPVDSSVRNLSRASTRELTNMQSFCDSLATSNKDSGKSSGLVPPTQIVSLRTKPQELLGQRVLLVDDSKMSLKMVNRLFSSMGAFCTEALDGDIAVDLVRNCLRWASPKDDVVDEISPDDEPRELIGSEAMERSAEFDMVVMDNLMPHMNGPEACAAMRALGFQKPIYGLTGHGLPEDIARFVDHGADYVFIKPLRSEEFLEVVRRRAVT